MTGKYNKIFFLIAFYTITILGCQKKIESNNQESQSLIEENITKIAPSKFAFEKWVTQALLKKGINSEYTILKVNYEEKGAFKMSEVEVEIMGRRINMFIATMFSFKAPPSLQKLVLSPETELATPTRTLIFSSGDKVNLNVEKGMYTFDALSNSLYYIGADIITH